MADYAEPLVLSRINLSELDLALRDKKDKAAKDLAIRIMLNMGKIIDYLDEKS